MRYARMIVKGVIAYPTFEYERKKILLQRAIDKKDDSVLITLDGNDGGETTYIIPTQALKDLFIEPFEESETSNLYQ